MGSEFLFMYEGICGFLSYLLVSLVPSLVLFRNITRTNLQLSKLRGPIHGSSILRGSLPQSFTRVSCLALDITSSQLDPLYYEFFASIILTTRFYSLILCLF